jgi:hypothetical protein
MAMTFDGLNAVDGRGGEFRMAQIQKIDRARHLLCVVGAAARCGFNR